MWLKSRIDRIVVIAKLHSSEMLNRGVTDLEIGYREDKLGEFETTCSRARK